ncbi:MAG TPA: hypothetical protein VN924_29805 [Bryobacteraceae bacterium]|nr:hypothetical protein [Bryobacteraceae bacterium]
MTDPSNQFISIRRAALALAAAGLCARAALAAGPFYLGVWKIASAVPAPWAGPARPDPSEMKSLVGRTVAVKPKEIAGPKPLACKGPAYRVKYYPADWLFQGAFGEMHARDNAADPVKIAASLGFHGSSWKTLETGCANELDFHFIDGSTAAIGLNDYVYTLKKQ